MTDPVAGWYPDPALRFELRYHNGQAWTADVATDGVRYIDPLGTAPASTTPANTTPASTTQARTAASSGGRNGSATASLTLGIIALCLAWLPIVVVLGAIAAILAVTLGVAGRRRAETTGVGGGAALAGVITGTVALAVCVVGVLFTVSILRAIDSFQNPAEHAVDITACSRDGLDATARGTLTNLDTEGASFSVRVYFVRPGTHTPRRQRLVELGRLDPGESTTFEATSAVGDTEVDCIVGAVRGPLPYGVDPGI